MEWHIITGEYPPQPGGVSDYTYEIAKALAGENDTVHIWVPSWSVEIPAVRGVEIHLLPRGFGLRWLTGLSRGLNRYPSPRNIVVQYVPHMYGWKSMNLAFCLWLAMQRRHNLMVMFHEVAYAFHPGQPRKHDILALVHRIMAWMVLRSANFTFTSTDRYHALLSQLKPSNSAVGTLRICSNIPFQTPSGEVSVPRFEKPANLHFTVGVFSSFPREINDLLEPVLPAILENSSMRVVLIGPAMPLVESLTARFPALAGRITTTGRVQASTAGPYLLDCDLLLQLYPDGACAARGTLIAALASGVPVVSTRGPATDDLLLSSGALQFAENSPEDIRATIEFLRSDNLLARKIGERGSRLYAEHFHPKAIVNSLKLVAT